LIWITLKVEAALGLMAQHYQRSKGAVPISLPHMLSSPVGMPLSHS
jgi:hypothetical protein